MSRSFQIDSFDVKKNQRIPPNSKYEIPTSQDEDSDTLSQRSIQSVQSEIISFSKSEKQKSDTHKPTGKRLSIKEKAKNFLKFKKKGTDATQTKTEEQTNLPLAYYNMHESLSNDVEMEFRNFGAQPQELRNSIESLSFDGSLTQDELISLKKKLEVLNMFVDDLETRFTELVQVMQKKMDSIQSNIGYINERFDKLETVSNKKIDDIYDELMRTKEKISIIENTKIQPMPRCDMVQRNSLESEVPLSPVLKTFISICSYIFNIVSLCCEKIGARNLAAFFFCMFLAWIIKRYLF